MIIEIGGKNKEYPGSALSNFCAYEFVFDGVECASMEGLLQSFKEPLPNVQVAICRLVGGEAKRTGRTLNHWKDSQILWWKGKAYERESKEYQDLLDRAFKALNQNPEFRKALEDTGGALLVHSIGSSEPKDTVLTEEELCDRLMELREENRAS